MRLNLLSLLFEILLVILIAVVGLIIYYRNAGLLPAAASQIGILLMFLIGFMAVAIFIRRIDLHNRAKY
jgi:hypothetical protein